ncbi:MULTISPECIES: toll/interleukin-1 receptor domain-containing protein [unclassified Pseudarthrobacter]|uniref:toll/interleukin-1 receptor domain-containing protein n=1 Tax=unclassified Pseudarthrobacter TaxID=2647000 RepID=UPI002D791DCA|nr:toll/interleukin-1 receptor domain-containing protein [Pseudarthrobacter sp. LT1]WRT14986.1 toll/interleukin-1 receptor domain-containing protein [Pseudarthrobacter sp. LT1]
MQRIFLSHQSDDKAIVRQVQGELMLMGAEPFFDELSILNGEVIPGRIEAALETIDVFVLFWSSTAAKSDWVTAERQAAWGKFRVDEECFLIVVLDDTPLPTTLAYKKYIDGRTEPAREMIAREILGLEHGARLIKAVQSTLDTWGIDIAFMEGYGPYAGCPECGAGIGDMEKFAVPDPRRETGYGYLRCTKCEWTGGGGEVQFY